MKEITILFGVIFLSVVVMATPTNGKVVLVIDGNTVEVAGVDGETKRVMLIGIDSPELGQAYGDVAKKYLEKLVLRNNVSLSIKGKDRWGNLLGEILVNGVDDPRVDMLKEGLAWTAEKTPNPELEPYRSFAQQKGRGLWKEENPTPPWLYRRQQTMMEAKSR